MSSFLAIYAMLKHLQARPNVLGFCRTIPAIYIRRLLRLTPLFYYVYLMYWHVGPLLINGAHDYVNYKNKFDDCAKSWWKDFLYVRNLLYSQQKKADVSFAGDSAPGMCIASTWYLDVDTQLFMLAPLIALVASLSPRGGTVLVLAMCLGSYAIMWLQVLDRDWNAAIPDVLRYWNDFFRNGKFSLFFLGKRYFWLWYGSGKKWSIHVVRFLRARQPFPGFTPIFDGLTFYFSLFGRLRQALDPWSRLLYRGHMCNITIPLW